VDRVAGHGAAVGGTEAAERACILHACGEVCEAERVPTAQGKIGNLAMLDTLAAAAARNLEQRRFGDDGDAVGNLAHFENYVHARAVVDPKLDRASLERLEAGLLDVQRVASGKQEWDEIGAVTVRPG